MSPGSLDGRWRIRSGHPWLGARTRAPAALLDRPRASGGGSGGSAAASARTVTSVEQVEQRSEVATLRGGQEGVDDLALRGCIEVACLGGAYPVACAAGQHLGRLSRPADDQRDFVERHCEHVVQHKGQPFRGVRVFRTTSRARPTESASIASCSGSRLAAGGGVASREPHAAPCASAHVQAHPCYHGGKPGSCVVNIVRLRVGKS